MSLLQNFETAVEGVKVAEQAQGSATRENEKALESLSLRTQAVKAEFQDLANNVIDKELIKSLLSLSKNGLQALNTDFGKTLTQITLLTAVGWGATSLLGALHIFGRAAIQIKNLSTAFWFGATAIEGVTGALTFFKATAFPIIAILSGLAIGGYKLYEAWRDANPTLEESAEKLNDLNSKLQANKDRLDEINSLSWNEKTNEILAEKDAIEKENEEIQFQIDKLEELRKEKLSKQAREQRTVERQTGFTFQRPDTVSEFVDAKSEAEAWDLMAEKYGLSRQELEKLNSTMEKHYEWVTILPEEYNTGLTESAQKYIDILKDQNAISDEQIEDFNRVKAEVNSQAEAIQAMGKPVSDLTDEEVGLLEANKNLNSAFQDSANYATTLNTAFGVTKQQANDLRVQYHQFNTAIENNNGVLTVNIDKLFAEAGQAAQTNQEIAGVVAQETIFNRTGLSVNDKITALRNLAIAAHVTANSMGELAMLESAINSGNEAKIQGFMYRHRTTDMNKILQDIQGGFVYTDTPKPPKAPDVNTNTTTTTKNPPKTSTSKGSTSKAKPTPTDLALKNFQALYTDLKHQRDMDLISEQDYYNKLEKLMQGYTKDAKAHMKDYGLTVEQINRNMYQYEKEIYEGRKKLEKEYAKDILENQKDTYGAVVDYFNKQIDSEIKSLEDQKDKVSDYWDKQIEALEEANKQLDEQIALEEKQANLAKARNKKQYVFKDGRFQYVSDVDAVSQAQNELSAYKREQERKKQIEALQKQKDEELKVIDDQIKGWQKYKQELDKITNSYENTQKKIIAEQVLGVKLEGDTWKSRLDNLRLYVSKYNDILRELNTLGGKESLDVSSAINMSQSDREALRRAGEEWTIANTKGDKRGAMLAHQKAESIRAKYGYSGGGQGNAYISKARVVGRNESYVPAVASYSMSNNVPTSASAQMNRIGNTNSMSFVIQNLNLPNVKDGNDFVNYIQNNFARQAFQYAKSNG